AQLSIRCASAQRSSLLIGPSVGPRPCGHEWQERAKCPERSPPASASWSCRSVRVSGCPKQGKKISFGSGVRMEGSVPDWQLPPGVSRGLWDYLHDPEVARGYDASLAGSALVTVDQAFTELYFERPGRLLDL